MDYFNRNEDSSHSPYYQQPVHKPARNTFAIASCVCGVLALATICTGILPIPLGALSILFACLSHRRKRNLETPAIAGIALSAVGLLFSAVLVLYTFLLLPQLLKDENFRQQLDDTSQQMYGMDFDAIMQPYYDMGILPPPERTGE